MKCLMLIHTPAPDSTAPRPAGGPSVEEPAADVGLIGGR
jgi:hypothetical protein